MKSFDLLKKQIIQCKRCPRLRTHCVLIAQKKKREFKDWSYWGNPVPGFGDEHAKLWIVGLAPGAHGANRTGRVFTGDSSGRWLYSALHRIGLSSSPESVSTHDGLTLKQAYISCICRCAPPQNRPTSQEIKNCHAFLSSEWAPVSYTHLRAHET
ncbi:MAG: uracil-DNA glycosylase, partial [Proteobacteria bacterium]|nr:uracil-DNA glycosylase [Pseudomonadota bacterium]